MFLPEHNFKCGKQVPDHLSVCCGHLDREAVWKMAKLVGALPTKFKGMHYCYDNANVKMLFTLAMYVWERQTRIRCRQHCGKADILI